MPDKIATLHALGGTWNIGSTTAPTLLDYVFADSQFNLTSFISGTGTSGYNLASPAEIVGVQKTAITRVLLALFATDVGRSYISAGFGGRNRDEGYGFPDTCQIGRAHV